MTRMSLLISESYEKLKEEKNRLLSVRQEITTKSTKFVEEMNNTSNEITEEMRTEILNIRNWYYRNRKNYRK